MIINKICEVLERIEGLQGKVFPVSVVSDDVAAPLAVYRFLKTDTVPDLSGKVLMRSDVVQVDFWGSSYDQLWEIEQQAQERLSALVQCEAGEHWIDHVEIGGAAASDAVDYTRGEIRRPLVFTIVWS